MHGIKILLKTTLLLAVFYFLPFNIHGQVTVKATLDSTTMLIGQQSLYHLEISGPAKLNYSLPVFPGDTLVNGIEILSRSAIDTTDGGNGLIELKADYLVTSFDSGLYYIPPFKVIAGLDTFESNYLSLNIITYDVDTTKVKIFDIKGAQSPPFVLSDYALEAILFLFIYGIILLVIWYVLRKKYKKKENLDIQLEDTLPPHILAIMELDRLRSEKIWKQGKNKEYYTELTDVLRKYIEKRFQINALEMTSDEILTLFKKDKTTQSVFQNLKQILQLSDLVKFAKIIPMESDNELSMMNSYLFVNQTRIEDIKTIEEQKEVFESEVEISEMKADKLDSEDLNKYMPK